MTPGDSVEQNAIPLRVGPVPDQSLDAAYRVLVARARWLREAGRRQRISNTGLSTYRQWQHAGANHAVYAANEIVGVFSLPRETFADWPEFPAAGPAPWLRALATRPDYQGRQIGQFAVRAALEIAGPGQPVYLDCVSGFLPGYYSRLGFEVLDRQVREYPDDGTYDITLMCHRNRVG